MCFFVRFPKERNIFVELNTADQEEKHFLNLPKKTEKLLKSTKRKVLQKKAGIKILKSFTDGKMRIMDEVYFFIYRVTRK